MGEPSKIYLSWRDIETAVEYAMHVMAYNHFKPTRIIGIARGGMIPAVMIAHRFGISNVDSLGLQLRDGRLSGLPPTTVTAMSSWTAEGCLFVDDLWDSGATMKKIRKWFPESLTCTLYYKAAAERNKPPINFPGQWMPEEPWLVFPWETVGLSTRTLAAGAQVATDILGNQHRRPMIRDGEAD